MAVLLPLPERPLTSTIRGRLSLMRADGRRESRPSPTSLALGSLHASRARAGARASLACGSLRASRARAGARASLAFGSLRASLASCPVHLAPQLLIQAGGRVHPLEPPAVLPGGDLDHGGHAPARPRRQHQPRQP